jgi:hypothetical protein
MCDDGLDIEFNTQAWKLFYSMIKFNPSSIDSLNKQNMHDFFKIISKSSSNSNQSPAVKNSALYFSKILSLPKNNSENDSEDEFEIIKSDNIGLNVPSEDVTRKYESAIQSLIQLIISKQLYTHIHSALDSNSYEGWPFQTLANLIYTIETHSSSQKLSNAYKKVHFI